jgi:hypothetical protein
MPALQSMVEMSTYGGQWLKLLYAASSLYSFFEASGLKLKFKRGLNVAMRDKDSCFRMSF